MNTGLFSLLDEESSVAIRAANMADATVLITGETGTGKSHLAHSIFKSSMSRVNKPFGVINLATLSETLIESELFGHEKGAFTGAESRRIGRLEACNGGTVFLDEVGELPPRLQAKLLDFIQYKKVTPVGSNRTLELDVRILAATNQNIEVAVAEGRFRADLYHRLNVFRVELPRLAQRKIILQELIDQVFARKIRVLGRPTLRLSNDVRMKLIEYHWPGNIRELENVLEFATAAAGRDLVTLRDLPRCIAAEEPEPVLVPMQAIVEATPTVEEPAEKEIQKLPGDPRVQDSFSMPKSLNYHESKELFEKQFLEHALRTCSGQINLTSRKTGLNKVSLADKIRRYSIDWRQIRIETFGPVLRAQSPRREATS